ncbi:MAG TPA: hypothetical protein DER01_13935, partial [Phycisphaerales bacterium]|nr:hypothetical protein [Phycisphaerales bacterium]
MTIAGNNIKGEIGLASVTDQHLQSPHAKSSLDQDKLHEQIEHYTPLVRSVCRQTLPYDFDLDDAIQETFVKLIKHRHSVHSNLSAWLSMTAKHVCADQMRRHINERNRIQNWSRIQNNQTDVELAQHLEQLGNAISRLTDNDRQLIIDRFFNQLPLRVLAAQRHTSVPTMSRHLKNCLNQLAGIYTDIQKHHKHPVTPHYVNRVRDGSMLQLLAHPDKHHQSDPIRLRVGFFLGWSSTLVSNYSGFRPPLHRSIATTGDIQNPNWSLVGIVEPDTWRLGKIESTLRDYEMLDGMVDGSNAEELGTLDAIFIGDTFCMLPRVLDALIQAVSHGVGLYNESTCGSVMPGWGDTRVLKLQQVIEAASFHTHPHHDMPTDATVHKTHPCLPGMKVGCKITVGGCGPVCTLGQDVQMLIAKDHMVRPTHDAKPHMTPNVRPVMTVG